MVSIDESMKIFLQEIVEYACEGNDVLVKTDNLLFNARTISPFTASISNFINMTDRNSSESDNS